MNSAELRAQVVNWLNEVKQFGPETNQNWNDYITGGENLSVLTLYTETHKYHIRFTGEAMNCTASVRKPRAGEDWIRGNDLHDGDFCWETFQLILSDIVSYELVAKVKPVTTETVSVLKE